MKLKESTDRLLLFSPPLGVERRRLIKLNTVPLLYTGCISGALPCEILEILRRERERLLLIFPFLSYLFISFIISKRSYPSVNGEKWSEGGLEKVIFTCTWVGRSAILPENTLSYLVPLLTSLKSGNYQTN